MSDLQIREALTQDTTAIGRIMEAVWPDSPPDLTRIRNVIDAQNHSTLIGLIDDTVVGFVDGFMTETVEGAARWEVDLLAVQPDYQRRGIASALVEASTRAAVERGAVCARGLVAVGNLGSERAFARCGYTTDGIVDELLVASRNEKPNVFEAVDVMPHLISVHTINYSGLWIEGNRTKAGLVETLSQLGKTQFDVAGAVIAESETELIGDAVLFGFERIGRYHWWQRQLKLD